MEFVRQDSQTEPSAVDEQDYVARYTATKHSWRGRYRRIFCIASSSIITLDPATLAPTNQYDLATDYEGAAPAPGKDDPQAPEFSINVRSEGRGKFKAIRFSCRQRAALLTDLHRVAMDVRGKTFLPPPLEFPVLHLKRRTGEWVPLVMRISPIGIETREAGSSTLHWCLDFRDMETTAAIVLADPFGRAGGQAGGFVLCPKYGWSSKAFTANQGSDITTILQKLTSTAKQHVGASLLVDQTQRLTIQQFIKDRAAATVGADETPIGRWSVMRMRTAGKGTLNTPGTLTGGVSTPRGGALPGSIVPRQLVLTKSSLVERRPDNYEAVIVRPLGAVAALVRFAEEPQMLALEFNDGCPTFVYTSTARDGLLAAVLDTVQSESQRAVPVLPKPTFPGHRIDAPLGSLGAGRSLQEGEVAESLHIKHLAAAAKDCLAEGGATPAAKAKLWRRVREFNACILYRGVSPSAEVPEPALMALLSMLPAPPAHLPPSAPPPPPPSPKAATAVIGLLACLRRLLGAIGATATVVGTPGAVTRVIGQMRSGSEGVAAEAAALIAMLLGGGPGDGGQPGRERTTLATHAKQALLSTAAQVTILVNRLRPLSVSPLLSLQVVSILEAVLCEPRSETTDDRTFHETLRQVAGLRRRLFALFGHPAAGVVETVAVIMRTIAEEDPLAAEPMRNAALRDGALLRHLVHAFFLPPGERREVSRELVALWADAHEPAMDLLRRAIPPGLVAYLFTQPAPGNSDETTAKGSKTQRRILQKRRGRGLGKRAKVAVGASEVAAEGTGGGLVPAGAVGGSEGRPATLVTLTTGGLGVGGLVASGSTTPGAAGEPQDQAGSPLTTSGAEGAGSAEPPPYSAVTASASPEVTSPAAVSAGVEGTLAAGGRLYYNWVEFWRQFERDHSRADLIWNESTRQELREALEAEVHHLEVERERSAGDSNVSPVQAREAGTKPEGEGAEGEADPFQEKGGGQRSWNYAEFRVKYSSLAKEVCVGEYYLRLLLEGGGGRSASEFPLRDPPAFFRALYHRFLCDADAGLVIDSGADDSKAAPPSSDFCDLNGLEGFGGCGGLGSSTRELCARAMAIVYEQHRERIGPFEGTAHITVLLDRTNDRALRHRLLLLLKALVKVGANAWACINVGGVELAVDLLASCHEATERTAIPLQSNLLAATPHMDAPKEWFYQNKDGSREGPVEKDALRRAWSKGEVDLGSKCWAAGMPEWKPLCAVRELRWATAQRTPVLTPVQVGEAALSILHDLVSVHSSLDDAGELVTPPPRAKRILSSSRCLPHVAQGVLSGEPGVVEACAALLEAICVHNPAAMARLYLTGAFYFCLAYAGSNLRAVARLFAAGHCHQAFHGGLEAAAASALPLAKRSVLGGLLPESLLYVLDKSGPQPFAAAMVAESDTPELIWTHKMRGERLITQVLQHLGDFPAKLPQHCHAVYEYAPMPPVTYPELQDEMWCHRYYLRNLCDETRFPEWPIVEHVEFLQSLLAMWREELTRRPLDLSEEEACAILEIPLNMQAEPSSGSESTGGESVGVRPKQRGVDEDVLKRQYRKMAMKYHPDKNPEGRDKFMAVQTAYERLQSSLQGSLQGPQPWRLLLLLRAQCILFRRYGEVLAPFKYAGYPMLLEAIKVDSEDSAFLSQERAPLLTAATELIWLTCVSSALNGEELVRAGGVGLLASLLGRCLAVVRPTSQPTEPAAAVVTNIMRTLAGLATFASARKEMQAFPGLVHDIVHCTELEHATTAVDAALQSMGQLAVDEDFQEAFLANGAPWYLVPLLLQYDATAEKRETNGPAGMGSSVQSARNLHAMLSARALSRLGGFMDGDLSTPHNADFAAALRSLFTPRLATLLKDRSPKELLRNLTANLETPQVIWNTATRAELLRFVDKQRASPGADGFYDITPGKAFRYQALEGELQVGDVYLRVYNQQPDFEVANMDVFCDALLSYISDMVERRRTLAAQPQPLEDKHHGDTPTVEHHPEQEAATGEGLQLEEQCTLPPGEADTANPAVKVAANGEGDSEVVERGEEAGERAVDESKQPVPKKKGEAELCVEHLAMALQALQNAIVADPHLAALFSTRPQLAPLLGCLANTSSSSGPVPELALAVLVRLTAHAPCVEAMAGERAGLLLLFQLLHTAPQLRASVVRLLSALAPAAEVAWAAAKNGGAVYVLEVLLPLGGPRDAHTAGLKAAAANLLGKLMLQPLHGPRVAIALQKFFPDGLVAVIRDGPGEAVVSALGQTTETPELVWSPAMAASLAQQIATLAKDLCKEQTSGRTDWEMPDSGPGGATPREGSDEPQVGGVYVRLFLKDPKFPLRNPKRFLEGLLDQYVAAAAAARAGSADAELPLLLSAAVVSLLRVQPLLADHVAHLGYVGKLVGAMAAEGGRQSMAAAEEGEQESVSGEPTAQERVRACCLRVLHQLANSTAAAEAMAAPNTGGAQVVPLLMRAVGWQGCSVLALETLKRVVTANNRARDALVSQGLKVGLVPVLLALLDWRGGAKAGAAKWNESEATVGRVLAVEVLRLLAAEGAYTARVQELLEQSEVWRAYKDQKHDLFLPTAAQSSTMGVAGFIEGPASATTFALPAPATKALFADRGKERASPSKEDGEQRTQGRRASVIPLPDSEEAERTPLTDGPPPL